MGRGGWQREERIKKNGVAGIDSAGMKAGGERRKDRHENKEERE